MYYPPITDFFGESELVVSELRRANLGGLRSLAVLKLVRGSEDGHFVQNWER